MKPTTIPTPSIPIREHGIFTWTSVQKFYNSLPCDICHCENAEDAKQYTKVLLIMVSAFVMAGIYDTLMEGGSL